MNTEQSNVSEQTQLWNGASGKAWVDSQALLDQVLQPLGELVLDAVVASKPSRVLDVGCGTGATTIALSQRLGDGASCLGVDISQPMLALAQTRAASERNPPGFVLGDAQEYAFEPLSFDVVMSRFGVMFFDDSVKAFANLRRATAPGGRLVFVAWRSASENPFMTTAERVAAPLLPNLPPRRPNEPGQFAFGDGERVRAILEASGWSRISIEAVDAPCTLPEAALTHYMTHFGPVGRVLHDADERTRHEFVEKVRAALSPYVDGPVVRFNAACWLVSASA